jgi:hypothetical protein
VTGARGRLAEEGLHALFMCVSVVRLKYGVARAMQERTAIDWLRRARHLLGNSKRVPPPSSAAVVVVVKLQT